MSSLNRHLIRNVLSGSLILYGVWAVGFFAYTWNALTNQFDDALAEDVATLVELTELDDGRQGRRSGSRVRFELELRSLADPASDVLSDARYFQLWATDGRVLSRSASLGASELSIPASSTTTLSYENVVLPGGAPGRAAYLSFMPRLDRDLVERGFQPTSEHMLLLGLARPTARLDETRRQLIQGLLLFGGLLPVCLFWVVRQAVGRGLEPMRRLAGSIAEMSASSLGSPVPMDEVPEEVRPVVARLNELFGRLDSAFQRERRLTADMAHELRTPIAELRMLAELGLQAGDEPMSDTDRRDVRDIALQMERQVDGLLALARSDAKAVVPALQEVDLTSLVERVWRSHRSTADRRRVAGRFSLEQGVLVRSDPSLLQVVVGNLLSNAAVYASPGTDIECRVTQTAERVDLSLSNTTEGLEPADVEHLCEPFWRKDPSRTDGSHSGLGLALVSSYASLLGASLDISLTPTRVFTVRLSLPSTTSS